MRLFTFVFLVLERLLIQIAIIFSPFLRTIRNRITFEEKNSFKVLNQDKDKTIGFSLSSEGEFEQVLPIIKTLLDEYGFQLNLIYSSASLETKIEKFSSKYPGQIVLFRLPILTFYSNKHQRQHLESLLSVKSFIFVRYDFYFFLLNSLKRKKIPLILLQAKGSDRYFKRKMFDLFSKISFSLHQDYQNFLRSNHRFSGKNVSSMDFRIFRIMDRLKDKNHSQLFDNLIKSLGELDSSQKIIFGSYYPEENFLVKSISQIFKGGVALIAPHHLSQNNLDKIEEGLTDANIIRISEKTTLDEFSQLWQFRKDKLNVVILNMKGVLCELYQSFELAYVGGGFGYSIHSILEPFLAGSFTIYGPQNKLSTEKETCAEIDSSRLASVSSSEEFLKVVVMQREKKLENLDFKNNIHSLYNSERLQSSIDWILE